MNKYCHICVSFMFSIQFAIKWHLFHIGCTTFDKVFTLSKLSILEVASTLTRSVTWIIIQLLRLYICYWWSKTISFTDINAIWQRLVFMLGWIYKGMYSDVGTKSMPNLRDRVRTAILAVWPCYWRPSCLGRTKFNISHLLVVSILSMGLRYHLLSFISHY